ncbi:glycerol uptake facilitator protein [Murinocardiopsis flavida]|uniref:Glycerol uptake facilitator protein n=2 Tax=Murinocardiopsis flavida TaxID=645275 RepID=A0A2P8DMR9_9ACTN|nr:glycerol uptake facilitator protein [Murinocardiopsis flavida]
MDPTPAMILVGEIMGTAILILFGNGVGAAVSLNKSKAKEAGWVVVTFGWGFGVLAGAYASNPLSGGHINPAVTLGKAIEGSTAWADVPVYILAQMIGAILGAALVWLTYLGQFRESPGPYLGVFATAPEIRNPVQNLTTEIIATFALVMVVIATGYGDNTGLGESGTAVLIVALLVVGIGMSLGGPTGYAINPARDLGPRIAHALLPLKGPKDSDWGYSWVPVVGPMIGAALAGLVALGAYSLVPAA